MKQWLIFYFLFLSRHQFKAQPMNTKIFSNPSAGIRKVPSKPATVPEAFHLSSNVKTLDRNHKHEEEHFEFHAKPFNKKILEGTVVSIHSVLHINCIDVIL